MMKPPPDEADTRLVLAQAALTQRALDGDVDAMIWWLIKYGGPEWQPRDAASRLH
jgi:hypothetical protein